MYLEGRPIGEDSGHTAGRKLLAQMYEAHVGMPMPPIALTERGKPYFTEGPWHFSISHSKGHVFCALSRRNIGIDAEEMDRLAKPALAEKILKPGELAQYRAAPERPQALLKFWVLKEAWVKLTGEGLGGLSRAPEFDLADPRVRQMQGCFVAVIEEEDHVI